MTSSILGYTDILYKYSNVMFNYFGKGYDFMELKQVESFLILMQQDKLFFDKLSIDF